MLSPEADLDVKRIANELHGWHQKNYPTETDSQCLTSIGEEFGELDRAELKQAGGIRGTWDHWQAEKAKEIGDVMITLVEYCARVDALETLEQLFLNLYQIPSYRLPKDLRSATKQEAILHLLGSQIGTLRFNYLINDREQMINLIQNIIVLLRDYAVENSFDLASCLVQRWETISKRDFIKNPLTGGREAEV